MAAVCSSLKGRACGLLWWLNGKESACNVGGLGLTPGLGRSPGEANGNPLQYSGPGNPMERGAWQTTVQGVAKNGTQLSKTEPAHTHVMVTVWASCS